MRKVELVPFHLESGDSIHMSDVPVTYISILRRKVEECFYGWLDPCMT